MPNKKFKIVQNIIDDAPFGEVNWCTISFVTPQKIPKTKYLDVLGFKVHNGYGSAELADADAKLIKEKNKNHDVYMSQIGKIYAWDDATRTDAMEYNNEKLNDMEKARREHVDKIKLMHDNFKNERLSIHANTDAKKATEQRKRMQRELYKKGLITKQEYELMKKENKPIKEIKEIAASMDKMNAEMEECSNVDYLDENEPTALKYGCLTIYSPKHIGGLDILCFKIRGMFQTVPELRARITKLEQLYPNDRIYSFEIGKWCAFSEDDSIESNVLQRQLNYSMKCYIDNISVEQEEFEKRTNKMAADARTEGRLPKEQARIDKRKAKKLARRNAKKGKANELNAAQSIPSSEPISENPTSILSDIVNTNPIPASIGNEDDDAAIQRIYEYLEDSELKDKYASDKSKLERVAVDMN